MYNATIKRMSRDTLVSVFVAEVDSQGAILRSNAVQCTGLEGTPAYGEYLRAVVYPENWLDIQRDNCAGYKRFLTGGR